MKPPLNSSDETQKRQSANHQQAQKLSDPQRRKALKENHQRTAPPAAQAGAGGAMPQKRSAREG